MSSIRRLAIVGFMMAAFAASFAACSGNAQPTQAPASSNAPTQASAETPTAEATGAATPTPKATPAPSATTKPSLAPTSVPTPAPTPVPSATPTSPASFCTGTAEHQAFFADAANKLPFDVYCAVLPAGWYFQAADYTQPNGGKLTINYKGPGGATLAVSEGAFCTTSAADCSPHVSIRGTAAFGDKPGMLDVLSTPPDVLVVYVNPGTKVAYQISSGNLTQAKFVALAAQMSKVPKS